MNLFSKKFKVVRTNGEIDIETYKRSLDLIHGKYKDFDDLGYV